MVGMMLEITQTAFLAAAMPFPPHTHFLYTPILQDNEEEEGLENEEETNSILSLLGMVFLSLARSLALALALSLFFRPSHSLALSL